MKLIQVILIVVAKVLIFIGDIVLFFFILAWKLIKPLFNFFKKIKNNLQNKFVKEDKVFEKEIYNSENKLKNLKLLNRKAKINKKSIKPQFSFKSFSLPHLSIPEFEYLLPHYPPFPGLYHRHKRRGRPPLPLKIPKTAKFKYLVIGTLASFLFLFMPLYSYVFIESLPDPRTLANQEIPQTTKIFDRNKVLLYSIYANQNRTNVPLSKIPKHFINATIAIEDKNFYKTPGFDIQGIARSAIADVKGQPLQGGSTITQQLIKTRLLTPERTVERKVKEIILAVWAEQIYEKDEILEMYFNQVPYGGTAWGAQAAAETYFAKSVEELTLAESSFLAGLPQAPTTYSPYGSNPNLWKKRQKDVLARMVEDGYISKEEAKNAEVQKLVFEPPRNNIKAPHFVMYIKDLLVQKYGLPVVERGGLSVITSLDIKTQEKAQEIITEEVEKSTHLGFTNAAALITNPKNGDILAMIGGKDYYDEKGGNYNVTTALRQPGSTIKVVTYSAALLNGATAATTIQDTPVSYASAGSPVYSPVNYDGRFHGTVTLRNALANSINIPAVKTLNQIGIGKMVNLAKDMGISTWSEPENYGLSITLGAAEAKMTDMATVYGTLANNGNKVDLNPFIKITTYQGAILEEKDEIKQKRVLPDEIAFIISNILADNNARSMEFGQNSPLNIPKHIVSVKTGTTDNKRDNWTIGYTPSLLTAVWVGNNDNSPMNPRLASGITGAAPIWNKIMTAFLTKTDNTSENYPKPENIVAKSCRGKTEYFIKGTENSTLCNPISIKDQEKQKNTP